MSYDMHVLCNPDHTQTSVSSFCCDNIDIINSNVIRWHQWNSILSTLWFKLERISWYICWWIHGQSCYHAQLQTSRSQVQIVATPEGSLEISWPTYSAILHKSGPETTNNAILHKRGPGTIKNVYHFTELFPTKFSAFLLWNQ